MAKSMKCFTGKRWAVTPNDLLEVLRQSIAEFNEQHHIEQRLTENCRENGLMFLGLTPGDGDCFFYAISSQLERVGAGSYNVAQLRQNCVEYIRQHPTYEVRICIIRATSWENKQCGFRTGPTQTELYKHIRWLEA